MESLFHGLIWEPEHFKLGIELWLCLAGCGEGRGEVGLISWGQPGLWQGRGHICLSWPRAGSPSSRPGRTPRTDLPPGPQRGSSLASKHVWLVWPAEPEAPCKVKGRGACWNGSSSTLHTCHEYTHQVLSHVPGPPTGPQPQGSFQHWEEAGMGPYLGLNAVPRCPGFSGAGALHRSFSQQWLVSSVTLDRYSNLLEPQFLHLYNGDDYCCFVPFSHHTFIKGIFLHVKHWRHLDEIQLVPALSRRYSLDKKECESKCQVPGWASRTWWSGNIWTLNLDIHRLEFQLWY